METASRTPSSPASTDKVKQVDIDSVVIRFVGDSGDGMQLTGSEFTKASALAGNDISTLPDYPAEIRAPAGTLGGVSGYQLNFSAKEVFTPGDQPDVLVAMNPAGLKANIADLRPSGTLIVNTGAFTELNLQKAGYKTNPLEDGSLENKYQVRKVDITKLTALALDGLGLGTKEAGRAKNFYALGLMFWLYNRPVEREIEWIKKKFGKEPAIAEGNVRAFKAGYNYGETAEVFTQSFVVRPASLKPGTYRNITGNAAAALGFVAAAKLSGVKLFLGSYPITPASDILHELSYFKNHGVVTFQAEDEIAGVGTAIGASFGGLLGLTTTSGPGIDLKSEAVSLAVMVELPLVVCDVQRGGPSTGLPTKTEQADLLAAMYGRHGECPVPIICASTPADCFYMAIEAFRLAVKYMTPVYLLTDGYLANGSEPWLIPEIESLPKFPVRFRTDPEGFYPYLRDPATLARPWVSPGTPKMEHRLGGLEKDFVTGNVSYDPMNHERMMHVRAEKVAGIAKELPPLTVDGPSKGKLLVLGWGSTYGAIAQAVKACQAKGLSVAHAHLKYLNPFQPNLGEILKNYDKVLVPEMNLGQLVKLVREKYLIDAMSMSKVQGKPFKVTEIRSKIEELLEVKN